MKKFLSYFILIISLSFILLYSLLFTSWGNGIVSELIENKINEEKIVDFKFEKFKLSATEIEIAASIDSNSNILIFGKYNMFDLGVNLTYNVDIKDLNKLKKFTGTTLNGALKIDGIAMGNKDLLQIKGTSNIFDSNTRYQIKLIDFEPALINIKVLQAKIQSALYTLNQPKYANGIIDLLISVKDARIGLLDGIVNLEISKGLVNNKIVNKHFKMKLVDKITFDSNINSKLIKDEALSSVDFNSSLFEFDIKETKANLKSLDVISDYKLNVKDLNKFYDILQAKLNGSFEIKGNVEKIKDVVSFNANSNILKSDTKISAKLINSKIKDLLIDIKKLDLQSTLILLNQPAYAKGYLDISADIPNANMGELDGILNTKIYDGLVNNKIVNKSFDMKLKDKLTFKANTKTMLNKNELITKSNIYTSKANIFVKETKVDLKTMKITSDYQAVIKDLSKLFDLTNTKMRGSILIDGNFIKDDNLLLTGKSNLLKGKLNYKLLNDDFTANLENINVLKALYMMHYPEVFDSSANLDIKYNLATSTGLANGLLTKGTFVKNKYSTMLDKFARFDITKEVYEQVTLESKINKNIINSIMHFKSKYTKIDIEESVLDTLKMTTNTLIKTNIKGLKFDTRVKGNVNSPKITLEGNKYLDEKKARIKKELKRAEDKIKAKLSKEKQEKFENEKKKLEDKIKNRLKNLF